MIGAKDPYQDPFDVGVPTIERIFFSQMKSITLDANRQNIRLKDWR